MKNITIKQNSVFFKAINYKINGIDIIIYPDKDAATVYADYTKNTLEQYLEKLIDMNKEFYSNAQYIIGFLWNLNNKKMLDVWKFNKNYVDNTSGLLCDVKVYEEFKECSNIEIASGNTLLILGYEEAKRRLGSNLDLLPKFQIDLYSQLISKKDIFSIKR